MATAFNRNATYSPDPVGKAGVEIPDAYNCEWIPENDAKGDAGVSAAREWLGKAQTTLIEANRVRAEPDLANTRRAHDNAIVAYADGELRHVLQDGYEAASAKVEQSRVAALAALERARDLSDNATWGPSIASAFQRLEAGERMSEALAAIARGDRRTVGVLLKGPHYASGLTLEQVAALEAECDRRFAPAELRALGVVENAARRLADAQRHNLRKLTETYAGTSKEAEALRVYNDVRKSYGVPE